MLLLQLGQNPDAPLLLLVVVEGAFAVLEVLEVVGGTLKDGADATLLMLRGRAKLVPKTLLLLLLLLLLALLLLLHVV
jgi:hypothetical protein